jgi:hypothetical protein
MSRRSRRILICSALSAAAGLLSIAAPARAIDWSNTAGGNFGAGTNWAGGIVPGTTDLARFNLNNTYTTNFDIGPTNAALLVSLGNVTFRSNGTNGRVYNVSGTASVSAATLGLSVTSTGTMRLAIAGLLTIGGAGNAFVSSGDDLSSAGMDLGTAAGNGTLSISGSGSTFTSTGATSVDIGNGGSTGNFSLSSSATASIGGVLTVGEGASNNTLGILSVSTGAKLTTNNIQIGTAGHAGQSGTLTVSNSISSVTQNGASTLTIGAAAGSIGTLRVTNSASFTTGTGLLTINPTGLLDIQSATVFANGDFAINGGTLNDSVGGQFNFRLAAGSTVNITNAGLWSAGFGGVSIPDTAVVNVLGAGSRISTASGGAVSLDGAAQLNVTAGAAVTTPSISMSGIGGAALFDNSTLGNSTSGQVRLLNCTSATLTIRNNSTAMAGDIFVGGADNDSATFNLQSGAKLTFSGNLFINTNTSVNASGAMFIDGATTSATQTFGNISIGEGTNISAILRLTSGAKFTSSPVPFNTTVIGPAGLVDVVNGTLTIGSALTLTGGTLRASVGVVNLNQNVTVSSGNILLNGGVLNFAANTTVTLTNAASLALNGGTLHMNGATLVTPALAPGGTLFDFNAGALGFTGSLTATPVFLSYLLGPTTTLDAGQVLQVTNTTTLQGPLSLAGGSFITGALSGGSNLVFNKGLFRLTNSTLSISPTGQLGLVLQLQTGQRVESTGTQSAVIDPAGTLFLSGGSLSSTGGISNNGVVQLAAAPSLLQGGTLINNNLITGVGRIDNSLVNTAAGEVRAGASDALRFTAPSSTNAGLINLLGGSVEFTGALDNPGQITGRGTFYATAGLANSGQISLSAGITDLFGPVNNTAAAKIIVTGGATATFHSSVTGVAGTEIRVATNSAAVFLAPVSGPIAFTGTGAKYFEAGVSATGAIAAGGATVVDAPASLTSDQLLENSLDVAGHLTIRANSPTSKVNQLSVSGSLDITNNRLIVEYTGSSPLASIRSSILSGAISSSVPGSAAAVGYAEASDVLGSTGGPFGTQSADASAVLVRYTLAGDANLDGAVDFLDLARLAQNYNTTVSANTDAWWSRGDFTGDGVVDFLDLARLAQSYNTALPDAPIPGATPDFQKDLAAAFASVPEPGALPAILLTGVLLTRSRRRRSPPFQ